MRVGDDRGTTAVIGETVTATRGTVPLADDEAVGQVWLAAADDVRHLDLDAVHAVSGNRNEGRRIERPTKDDESETVASRKGRAARNTAFVLIGAWSATATVKNEVAHCCWLSDDASPLTRVTAYPGVSDQIEAPGLDRHSGGSVRGVLTPKLGRESAPSSSNDPATTAPFSISELGFGFASAIANNSSPSAALIASWNCALQMRRTTARLVHSRISQSRRA